MRRTLLIAQREFLENVKTKGFWLGIFLFPILISVSALLPGFLAKRATPTRPFLVIDATGKYDPIIAGAMEAYEGRRAETSSTGTPRPVAKQAPARFRKLPAPPEISPKDDIPSIESRLRPLFFAPGTNALFAAIIIPVGFAPESSKGLRYWCVNQADTTLRDLLERTLRAEFRSQEYARLGLDPAAVQRTESLQVPITDLNPTKAAGSERVGVADQISQWAPSLFVYLLWVAIFAVSQMLLNSVIEEKSNRLIEVLLSSVTPGQFMMGKLIGIAAVGFVMLGSWLGSMFGVAWWQTHAALAAAAPGSAGSQIPQAVLQLLQGSWLLPAFAFYFICGYVLYAGIFLTIGSLCNTIKEAQNFMGPMMMVLMVPLFLMPFIPRDPNGPLASFLSWIPLYTPFVMMNRVAAHPPLWQVIGTGIVLVGFIGFTLWICGRIFRLAILRTGQPPKIVELVRWITGRHSG